ncbi:MAG: type II toxin-antitoxin system VapC family toxin [Limisphaerales bacterium]
MTEYFDTPILVFACANKGEVGQRARELVAAATDPLTTPHALAECFNALTYRLGIPPHTARALIAANTRRFRFVRIQEDDYFAAIDHVVSLGLTGDKVYDALHAGAAVKGAAGKIHTSNHRDFSRFNLTIPIERTGPPRLPSESPTQAAAPE